LQKFGFDGLKKEDEVFFNNWQGLMQELALDHTLFFNKLEKITPETDLHEHFSPVAYAVLNEEKLSRLKDFMEHYQSACIQIQFQKLSLDLMKKTNPKFMELSALPMH
jgi:uncharacterized protein YdiU (UPF0061 family)